MLFFKNIYSRHKEEKNIFPAEQENGLHGTGTPGYYIPCGHDDCSFKYFTWPSHKNTLRTQLSTKEGLRHK